MADNGRWSTVILIRHAEKPGGPWPGPGLTEDGRPDPDSLVLRGWQRAGALTLLFGGRHAGLPRPERIYASGTLKHDGSGQRSRRPLQTVVPLAVRLGIQPIDRYSKGDERALAAELAEQSGVSLVSWQHEALPDIAARLLGAPKPPATWPDTHFDLIWLLARPGPKHPWSFSEARQDFLPDPD